MKKYSTIIFLILISVCFIPTDAYAIVGTLTGAIIGAISYIAGATTLTLLQSVIVGAVMGSLSYLSARLTAPDQPGTESNTYKGPSPVVTIDQASPIPIAFGLCRVAGNIIRQNDLNQSINVNLIVCHGMGEWDQIIGHYINDIEWSAWIQASPNFLKWTHLGAPNQTTIDNIFTVDAPNYRNKVITEYQLRKGEIFTSLNNVNITARTTKCLEIGQNLGGTKSWTRNPAQIMWHFYVTIEKKTATELDINAFISLQIYCSTPMSAIDPYYSDVQPPVVSKTTINATSEYSLGTFAALYAIMPNLRPTGGVEKNGWLSAATYKTNQRINIDFGRKIVITKIEIVNYHKSGTDTDKGIKNFIIQGSNLATSFNDTTYASIGWTDVETGLQCSEHTVIDEKNSQSFIFADNHIAYRYYAIKIADNWGDPSQMGLRGIRFYGGNSRGSVTTEEYNNRYTFDYNFDSKIEIQDAKKLIWQSFHGICIQSQGKIKPVWDGSQEHNGAGSLQTKTVKFAFDTETNILKGTLKWSRISSPNVFLVNHLDSSNNFKKDSVCLRNEDDINIRGEIVDDETCWYLIDRASAKRRCKYNYNRSYREWSCELTGFPSSQSLELFDRVTITDTEVGWTAKDFVIVSKDEDEWGRPTFYLEEYLSGIYSDQGFEEQQGYATDPENRYITPIEIDPSTVIANYNSPTSSDIYAGGSIDVTFTPPLTTGYSYTEVWISTDNINYMLTGTSNNGGFRLNGLGTYYWPGDTIYIKLRSVNADGVKELMPENYCALVLITAGSGMIQPTHIADFAIDASKIFTKIPILDGGAWYNNMPSSGYITWGNIKIFYNGSSFTITNGNTNLKYIYWLYGHTSFNYSNTNPSLGNDDFIIAVNISGTYDLAWNAIANEVIGTAYIQNAAIINAKIADLAVNDAKIENLSVGKLTAGSIISKIITLSMTEGLGDVALRAGKTDFGDPTSGLILGIDDSDSNRPKIEFGDATEFMKYSPTTGLLIGGTVTATDFIATGSINENLIGANSITRAWDYQSTSTISIPVETWTQIGIISSFTPLGVPLFFFFSFSFFAILSNTSTISLSLRIKQGTTVIKTFTGDYITGFMASETDFLRSSFSRQWRMTSPGTSPYSFSVEAYCIVVDGSVSSVGTSERAFTILEARR